MLKRFLLVLILGISSGLTVTAQEKPKLYGLRFGQDTDDFIDWSPNIDPLRANFTVCSWIRRNHQSSHPILLQYFHPGYDSGMILGAEGVFNQVVGTPLYLQDHLIPVRRWYHLCWTWRTYPFHFTVFFNGVDVGSRSTRQRYLRTGGKLRLGNGLNIEENVFGGDMFRLNAYSRVLSEDEIVTLASDMCTPEEPAVDRSRIIRWEEILMKERTGSVIEIATGCYGDNADHIEAEGMIISPNRSQNEGLNGVSNRLKETERELAETKADLSKQLRDILLELNKTKVELEELKKSKKNN